MTKTVETTPRDEADNLGFPTWTALVEARANGWVAVVIMTRPVAATRGKTESWPWVVGPFPTKREANNARNRLRTKWRRDMNKPEYAKHTATFAVRPAWKDTDD